MPKKTSQDSENEYASASIEQLLEAENAVEARLAEARETAAKCVADAYNAAQSIERQTDARIARLAKQCAQENDRRVESIVAEAEEIAKKQVDARSHGGAIREAAKTLAAQLTGAKP